MEYTTQIDTREYENYNMSTNILRKHMTANIKHKQLNLPRKWVALMLLKGLGFRIGPYILG